MLCASNPSQPGSNASTRFQRSSAIGVLLALLIVFSDPFNTSFGQFAPTLGQVADRTSPSSTTPAVTPSSYIGRSLSQRPNTSREPEAIKSAPQPIQPETIERSMKGDKDELGGWLQGAEGWMGPKGVTQSLQTLLLLTLLSVAPAAVLMTTCYVRVAVVLAILKQGLGNSQLPPSQVMSGIALFITLFVMSPVWKQVYEDAVVPYSAENGTMTASQAWTAGTAPVRRFMSQQIAMAGNYDDVHLFYSRYAPGTTPPENFDGVPTVVLLPAYMLSELKTAFLIGFQIFLPFLVLDLVIASVIAAMGLNQLSPATVAIPFKLLLFVLVDGWRLVVQMLIDSFGTFPAG